MNGRLFLSSLFIAVFIFVYQFNITEIISTNGLYHTGVAFCITVFYMIIGCGYRMSIIYALACSIGKEFFDPTFSYMDIANDLIGIAFAIAIFLIISDRVMREVHGEYR